MSPKNDLLAFQEAYLDYREGLRTDPPSLEGLPPSVARLAKRWIAFLRASAGIDPYASRPSTAEVLAAVQAKQGLEGPGLVDALETGLQQRIDRSASVVIDAASLLAGFASRWIVRARGLRLRVVVEPRGTRLHTTFEKHAPAIAAIFGSFPETFAVLVATDGPDAMGTVVGRYDIVRAIEAPSGREAPPRIRRAIVDPVTACCEFIDSAIPLPAPFAYVPLALPGDVAGLLDLASIAAAAIRDAHAAGERAQIGAKRAALSELSVTEGAGIAALIAAASRGELKDDGFHRRFDAIVGAAA